MSEEKMLQIDYKRAQREQNYRRAEAFLLWKFGPMWDDARRFLRGSGMDWPSLFVEFVETVERDVLERTRIIEEQHFKSIEFGFATNPTPSFEMFKYPLALETKEPRKPFRRHWKDDPGAYTTEELEKLRKEENGE